MAFGKAVTEAAPLDEFMQEGTVILLQDVDLSAFSQTASSGRPKIRSHGTFDGKGTYLTVSLNDGDAKELGLFHTPDATAAVKNLTLAGSMTVTQPNPGVAGNPRHLRQRRRIDRCSPHARDRHLLGRQDQLHFGLPRRTGRSGQSRFDLHRLPQYRYVQHSGFGPISMLYLAVSVGGALINTKGSLTNCSNSGKFEFNFSNKPDSGMFGGLVGYAETSILNFTRLTTRAISPSHSPIPPPIPLMGGILGNGYGTFVRCINKGDIHFGTAKGTNYRRTGGIIGCVGANDDAIDFQRTLSMSDCRATKATWPLRRHRWAVSSVSPRRIEHRP